MMFRYLVGLMFVVFGVSALLGVSIGRFIGPLFLILMGILVLSGRGRRRFGASEVSHDPELNETWVFTGVKRKIKGDNFSGGTITAIFGGAEIDISEVKPKGDEVEMEVTAVFGGIKLRVPEGWRVSSEAVGILGGVDNHARGEGKVILRIKGAAIFGGIEITH